MNEKAEKKKKSKVVGKRKRSRPMVTHIRLLMGRVCLNSVSLWGRSRLSTRDLHQHIMSKAMKEDGVNEDGDENDEAKDDDGRLVFPINTSTPK